MLPRSFLRPSLKSRLSLLTLAIFLLGIWSITVYATQRLQRDMLELLGTQQFATVSTVAAQLDSEIKSRLTALDKFAEGVPRSLLDKPVDLQAYVASRADLQLLFNAGIQVRDAQAKAVAMFPDANDPKHVDDIDQDDLAKALREGLTTVGKPAISSTFGATIITMVAPIFDFKGEARAAVVGTIRLDKASFFDVVTNNRMGITGGYLVLAPEKNLIVVATDASRNLTSMPAPGINRNHDRFVSGYEGYGVAVNSRGTEELAAARQLPAANWIVVGVWPTAELLAPITATQRRVFGAASVVSVLAGLLAWVFVRRMLRQQFAPMVAATHALSGMVGQGGVALQPLVKLHDDEVGQLIDSFNRLIDNVQRNEITLKQDIERRAELEIKLREKEARFRKVFEQLPLSIGLMSPGGQVVALNDRFVQLFGYTQADIPDIKSWAHKAYPDPAELKRVKEAWHVATQRAAITGGDIELPPFKLSCKDGTQRDILISGITLSDGVLTTFTDLTDSLQRKATLARQHGYTDLMRRVAMSLINLPMAQLDDAIESALGEVGLFLGADRAYVFGYDFAAQTTSNTHEWCATGIEPQIQLQHLPIEMAHDWVKAHTQGKALIIPSVQELPAGLLREILEPQGVCSLLSVPVMATDRCLGFVGIDAVRTSMRFGDAESNLLAVFAELLTNLTGRKQAEADLRLAANVFTYTHEGIAITDSRGNIVDVNTAFTAITGYSRDEVLGKNPRILSSGKQDKAFYTRMWTSLQANGFWQGEIWNRHKNGNVFAELLNISTVRDNNGVVQNHIALFTDITAIKSHQAQLERMAHYDALTGLPNRLLLADRLRQAIHLAPRRGQYIAIAYLDLDGFKAINDTHGHEVGDELLKAIAHNMQQVLRDSDTLARLGGDEFVAVLVDLPATEASVPMFTRLLDAAAQHMHVTDKVLHVTASLGVTFYPQADDMDADQLLRQADQAMYLAKQAGKNRYHVFDAEQDRNLRGHHESLMHIRQALVNCEFVLHYQPKVNMRTGKVLGAEALIRWQHPQRGLLPPGVFLPAIEGHPLSIDLGEWVIDTALSQIEAWHAQGLTMPVSVNVGALQLQRPTFVSRLSTLMLRHPGVQRGELELEVLETSALEDFTVVSQVMAACHDMGVKFALDDFGTGYSSLTYLKQLPTELLKIDQSFVRDMLDDPDDLAILEGVLGLARAFKRNVIAEGVETPAHAELLLRLGCEWGQGYAIARPMPARDLPEWVGTWSTPASWQTLTRIPADRMPALHATVAHRAWVAQVVHYLRGHSATPPLHAANQCPLGMWLHDDHSTQGLLDSRTLQTVDTEHGHLHARAADLIALKRAGHTQQALSGVAELHLLRDRLLGLLNGLF